jgi:hypothetical protein
MSTSTDPPDLGDFRNLAASLVRYLIRAREKAEPGFLTAAEYDTWGLTAIAEDRRSIAELLELARRAMETMDERWLSLCKSGGLAWPTSWQDEGPVGRVKICVAMFADYVYTLPDAIQCARENRPIDWVNLASWNVLAEFRAALDGLPQASKPTRERPDTYITLDQAAARVSRTKRTLEGYKNRGLPAPAVRGGHGKPSEYLWSVMRPWLEATFGRQLPEDYPSLRTQ